MFLSPVLPTLLAALAGVAAALAILLGAMVLLRREAVTGRALLAEAEGRVAFLFDGEDLLDVSDPGREMFAQTADHGSDWDRLLALLGPSFPDLAKRIGSLGAEQRLVLDGAGTASGTRLDVEYWDGLVRLAVLEEGPEGTAVQGADPVTAAALEAELDTLRSLAEDSPQLIWVLDSAGEIVWANRAYLDLCPTFSGAATDAVPAWPPARIFETIDGAPLHGEAVRRRVSVPAGPDGKALWFEVTSQRRGTGSVHFAVDASGLVKAEKAQREFVQTLTKTFADLSIGMVIFDRHRRLVLFNPAFLDMSGLPVDFLSARPLIQSVLDRLRESRVLPEPKNYASWRDQMAALETAAIDGSYCENWNLPTGQTFRVTGRPHPDGAIAFLFEDISAEVSLTRRFRSELEFGQAVIDNIAEAVAVFSPTGAQIATNRIHDDLWSTGSAGPRAEIRLTELTLDDALATWRKACAPTGVWQDLRDFALNQRQRGEWSENLRMTDGRGLVCRFVPLPGGATMVTFRPSVAQDADSGETKHPSSRYGLAAASG